MLRKRTHHEVPDQRHNQQRHGLVVGEECHPAKQAVCPAQPQQAHQADVPTRIRMWSFEQACAAQVQHA
jgi:hypothetical protein